jgi:hypothetical protein
MTCFACRLSVVIDVSQGLREAVTWHPDRGQLPQAFELTLLHTRQDSHVIDLLEGLDQSIVGSPKGPPVAFRRLTAIGVTDDLHEPLGDPDRKV